MKKIYKEEKEYIVLQFDSNNMAKVIEEIASEGLTCGYSKIKEMNLITSYYSGESRVRLICEDGHSIKIIEGDFIVIVNKEVSIFGGKEEVDDFIRNAKLIKEEV